MAIDQEQDVGGQTIEARMRQLLGGNIGTAGSGNVSILDVPRTFNGALDGSTVMYGEQRRLYTIGATPIDIARTMYLGTQHNAAGLLNSLEALHAFGWTGPNTNTLSGTGISSAISGIDANSLTSPTSIDLL
jgi:hypothetical protein